MQSIIKRCNIDHKCFGTLFSHWHQSKTEGINLKGGLRNKLKGYFIFFKTVSRETEESINLGRKVLGRCFLKSCKGQKTQRG